MIAFSRIIATMEKVTPMPYKETYPVWLVCFLLLPVVIVCVPLAPIVVHLGVLDWFWEKAKQ